MGHTRPAGTHWGGGPRVETHDTTKLLHHQEPQAGVSLTSLGLGHYTRRTCGKKLKEDGTFGFLLTLVCPASQKLTLLIEEAMAVRPNPLELGKKKIKRPRKPPQTVLPSGTSRGGAQKAQPKTPLPVLTQGGSGAALVR